MNYSEENKFRKIDNKMKGTNFFNTDYSLFSIFLSNLFYKLRINPYLYVCQFFFVKYNTFLFYIKLFQ